MLLLETRGRNVLSREERRARQDLDQEPNSTYLEDALGADVLDEQSVIERGGMLGRLYNRLPGAVAQAVEARRRAGSYDVVVTRSERHAVAVAALFSLTFARTPHIMLSSLLSKTSVRVPLRLFRRGVDTVITWSTVQRDFAVDRLGFSQDRVVFVPHPVDLDFFHPVAVERKVLFSAGSTNRDFRTLADAVSDLGVPLRIGASIVVLLRGWKAEIHDVRDEFANRQGVEVVALDQAELRDSYAEARVVVVPVYPTDMDNGVSVVLEAMAMGRPVITSGTVGQVDVIEDGVTGYYVPPEDPEALHKLVKGLLDDPDQAEAVGARARQYVEGHHSINQFCTAVRTVAWRRAQLQ